MYISFKGFLQQQQSQQQKTELKKGRKNFLFKEKYKNFGICSTYR